MTVLYSTVMPDAVTVSSTQLGTFRIYGSCWSCIESKGLTEDVCGMCRDCVPPICVLCVCVCFPFVIPWSVCVWLTTEQRQPSIISVRVLGRPLFAAEHVITSSVLCPPQRRELAASPQHEASHSGNTPSAAHHDRTDSEQIR